MQTINKQTITIDLKQTSMIPLPQFIQQDSNAIEFIIKENGVLADLTNIGRIVANFKRHDKKVISRLLAVADDKVLYELGIEEMEVAGHGEVEIQFFSTDNLERISTKRFKVHLLASIGTDTIYENSDDLTLLQELFVEVESLTESTDLAAQYASEAAEYAMEKATYAQTQGDTAKTKWLTPVSNQAAISTTYTSPVLGDTVQVLDTGYVYRFNGTTWIYTQGYSATALANVTSQLADIAQQSILKLYVSPTGNDNNTGTSSSPFLTIQKAVDSIPNLVAKDVEIILANGTYSGIGGYDEWGREVLVKFAGKFLNAERDVTLPLTTKGGKIKIKGNSADKSLVVLQGTGQRNGVYAHNMKNIYLQDLTINGFNNGVLAHEGGDVTVQKCKIYGNTNGILIETDSRVEIGYSEVTDNTYNFYLKNGQLQANNTDISRGTENSLKIEGSPYVLLDTCTGVGTANKIMIESKGCNYMDIKVCDFGGGFAFFKGTCQHLQISQGTHIYGFTSYVLAPQGGFINVLSSHLWNNNFVIYATEGNPLIKMDNCTSNNKSGVDTPNTQATPIRINCAGTLQITGTTITPYKVLYAPPNDSPILFGSAIPTTGFHFKGKVMFNTAAASGQPMGWICTTAGVPGTWNALSNIV